MFGLPLPPLDLFTALFLASIGLNAVMMPLFAILLFYGRPALVYAMAKLRGKDLLAAFYKNGRFKLIPADYKGLEIIKNAAWIPKRPKFFNWGGVQVAIVYDGWGILFDPEMELAVKALQEKGINSYEELEQRIAMTLDFINKLRELRANLQAEQDEEKRKEIENKINEIENWLNLYGINRSDPVVYRAFGILTVKDIEDYFTDMYPSEIKAHIDENIADIAQQYINPINKVGAYVVYGILALGGIGVTVYLIKAAFGG